MRACVRAQEEALEYGVDWSGPSSTEEHVEQVVVPQVPDILTPEQFLLLKSLVKPLDPCEDYGKELYVSARKIVREMLGALS